MTVRDHLPPIDNEAVPPGPSPETITYRTDDGRTVIYDENHPRAWISSTHSLPIEEYQ